jgi:hypothetical protein
VREPNGADSTWDLGSIRDFARKWDHRWLEVLTNDAGIAMVPFARTADGIQSEFGINHLGTGRPPRRLACASRIPRSACYPCRSPGSARSPVRLSVTALPSMSGVPGYRQTYGRTRSEPQHRPPRQHHARRAKSMADALGERRQHIRCRS